MNPAEIARVTLESWLTEGQKPLGIPPLRRMAGCFVSLHDADGRLRGCIGTIQPQMADLSLEIMENAVAAASRDPRFPPLEAQEMNGLQVEVSEMGVPEDIATSDELDPSTFGVIVRWQGRQGVLLPDIEGVDSIREQVLIAKKKARIPSHVEPDMQRFRVIKHV